MKFCRIFRRNMLTVHTHKNTSSNLKIFMLDDCSSALFRGLCMGSIDKFYIDGSCGSKTLAGAVLLARFE